MNDRFVLRDHLLHRGIHQPNLDHQVQLHRLADLATKAEHSWQHPSLLQLFLPVLELDSSSLTSHSEHALFDLTDKPFDLLLTSQNNESIPDGYDQTIQMYNLNRVTNAYLAIFDNMTSVCLQAGAEQALKTSLYVHLKLQTHELIDLDILLYHLEQTFQSHAQHPTNDQYSKP